jgi:hypothetical protein
MSELRVEKQFSVAAVARMCGSKRFLPSSVLQS